MINRSFRCFGIVPAAGDSKRMGAPKLLLPYQAATLIEHVLAQWAGSRVEQTLVVVNPGNQALIETCKSTRAVCVIPDPAPAEMKHSVQAALRWIEKNLNPKPNDAWLLAPADLPHLSSRIIDLVISGYDPCRPTIVVPRHGQRRGHPAMFPWSLAGAVYDLLQDQGVNHLFDLHDVVDVQIDRSDILDDVDTPDDYQRAIEDRL